MRAYRFVAFLGAEVADAGRSVAASAHVEFDHSGGLAAEEADTPSERVGRELLRRIARRLDSTDHGNVEFSARALAPVRPEERATSSPGGDVGFLLHIDLPGFDHRSALIGKSIYEPSIRDGTLAGVGDELRTRIDSRLESTPSTFLFLISDTGVRVVSGSAAVAIEDRLDHQALTEMVYSKDLGRFAQDFAEGFVGDPRLTEGIRYPNESSNVDQEIRAWATEYDVQGVLFVRVSLAPNREPASLRDFV